MQRYETASTEALRVDTLDFLTCHFLAKSQSFRSRRLKAHENDGIRRVEAGTAGWPGNHVAYRTTTR